MPGKKIIERNKSQSCWPNGLYYLVSSFIIIISLGYYASNLPLCKLIVISITAIILITIIGAFQLCQDNRLSESSLLSIIKIAMKQLALIKKTITNNVKDQD